MRPAREPNGWGCYRSEVFSVSFPELGPKTQVSVNGGGVPRWTGRGDELFYRSLDGDITVVSVNTQGRSLGLGARQILFPISGGFDIAPDGQHFAVVAPNPDAPAREIRVVLNFFEELKAKVGN